jgi:hypothetical protein
VNVADSAPAAPRGAERGLSLPAVDGVALTADKDMVLRGRSVVPLLQRIRGEGPGRQRAGALTVLAELGGETALSPADRAAVERLIRVKLLDDRPAPLWACWNHWIAVPGGDQAGIIETLGLAAPRPVTFALALDIIDADSHGCAPGDRDGYARVRTASPTTRRQARTASERFTGFAAGPTGPAGIRRPRPASWRLVHCRARWFDRSREGRTGLPGARRHARPLPARTVPPLTGSAGDDRVRNPRIKECLP